MNFQQANKLRSMATLAAFGLVLVVAEVFNNQETRLRTEQQDFLRSQQAAWSRQDIERALSGGQQAEERKNKYAVEMVQALGGPVAAATKDPALDIRGMLTQTGLACAPTNTEVSVTVDRFTEFDVAFVLHEPPSFIGLAKLSKRFLESCVPYVHSIRFIQGNEVLAELSGPQIESVTNWNSAPAESVEELLLATSFQSRTAEEAGTASGGNATEPDPEILTPEQIKIAAAQKTFSSEYATNIANLNGLISDLNYVTRLDTLRGQELPTRITWVNQQSSQISAEREFFINQASEMEQLLNDQESDSLVITIIVRGLAARGQAEAPWLNAVFDALSDYQSQIHEFLVTMQNHEGEWSMGPSSSTIHFSTTAAHDAYVAGTDAVKQSSANLKNAIDSWSNYKNAHLNGKRISD